jgi:RHS repeat-associated protein
MLCNVNIGTGDVYHFAVDLALRSFIPFRLIRNYDSSRRHEESALGFGWRHSLSQALLFTADGVLYRDADGNEVELPLTGEKNGLTLSGRGSLFHLTDAQGNTVRFERLVGGDPNRLPVVAEVDPRGNTTTYHYTRAGVLTHVVDTARRTVHFGTDARGHIVAVAIQYADRGETKQVATFLYDQLGDLVEVHNRGGVTHRFRYSDHLLTEHTNPLGGVTYFEYDGRGRCVHTYRSDGTHLRTLLRDDLRNTVQLRTSSKATWVYHLNEQGNPTLVIDPMGRRKQYVYDEKGQLKFVDDGARAVGITVFDAAARTLTTRVGSIVTSDQYDDRMRLVAHVLAGGAAWRYAYDDRGNRLQTLDPGGRLWQFVYDDDGWLAAARDPRNLTLRRDRSAPGEVTFRDAIGVNARLLHDGEDRLVATIDGAGHETRFGYDPGGNLHSIRYADGAEITFEYNANGDMTTLRSEIGAVTTFEYDAFGAPLALRNAARDRGTFDYDAEGNITRIVNFKGETATLYYDVLDGCAEARLFDGRTQRYVRDPRGEVTEVRTADGRPFVNLTRDEYGRITRKRYRDGWEVNYEWGPRGELVFASNPDATVSINWTSDRRVAAERVNDFSIAYEYDAVGNRTRLTTSAGREIHYEWDARNRLLRIVDSAVGTYAFEYDAANMFAVWRCPSVTQEFAFDARLRMVRRTARGIAGGDLDRTFNYDPEGRLTRTFDVVYGDRAYEYSAIGAIQVVTAAANREEYRYDADHNLRRTWDGADISYSAGDRLNSFGGTAVIHDEHGSIVGMQAEDGHLALEYSLEGHLRAVTTANGRRTEYRYDPLGRRISKDVAGMFTRYFWDQGAHLGEVNGGTTDYLFLPGTLLPLGLATGGRRYSFVLDQAGTPTDLIDADGQVVWRGDYTAFGEPRGEPPTALNPFHFQGHYVDRETGFHYNFARYYFPRCARYLSQDPLGLEAGGNLYRYVLNPYNWVDPFGLNNLANGVLTIYPICGWSKEQQKDAQKKMKAMNSKIGSGIALPSSPGQRCGKTAKEIYENCQEEAKEQGKKPQRDLNESSTKCTNEQADHIIEICAGGGEEDCKNLQPLNESVNKSFGSQVAAAVRANPGAMLTKVEVAPMSPATCTDRGFQC